MTSVGVNKAFINRDVGKYVKIHDATMYVILSNIHASEFTCTDAGKGEEVTTESFI